MLLFVPRRVHFYLFIVLIFPNLLAAQAWHKQLETSHNLFEIQDAFNSYWEGKTPGKGEGYKPFKRWEHYWSQRVDTTGELPAPSLKLLAWEDYLNKHQDAFQESQASWINLGPSLSEGGYHGIGRINCIAFHPSNSNTFWVGSAGGGLWRTTNGGSSWTSLTEQLDIGSMAVTSIVVSPQDPNTIYMATGDGYGFDTYSVGVYKTTNGGGSWQPTGLVWDVDDYNVIRKMLIHPSNPNILFAATSEGVYRTTNGGNTWSLVLNSSLANDLEFKPGDPTVMYTCVTDYFNNSNKIYRSTNSGQNWTLEYTISSCNRTAMAVSPANPDLVLVVASDDNDGSLRGIYGSTNSGNTFSLRTSTPNILGSNPNGTSNGGQGWYDLAIAISPTNANLVYVGGVNMWRSTNGGFSWTAATQWNENNFGLNIPEVHADFHELIYQNNTTLFVGCDGGIYKTSNNGSSFTDLSDGLVISQMYRVSSSQTDNKVLVGLQDNGTKLKSTNGNWTDEVGGDGMHCHINPSNSNIMYGAIQRGDNIYRSTNGGASWFSILGTLPGDGAWVTPLDISQSNPNHLVVGYQSVYRSTNQGTSWTAISSPLSSSDLLYIKIAPSNSSVIYVATSNRLWKTTNAGSSWTELTSNLLFSNVSISRIAVDPDNSSRVCLTYSGYSSGRKVIRSTNGGSTWTNISGTLPNLPANCITYHDNGNGSMYLGMDIGVYYRDDSMSDWILYSDGLPNVEIFDLDVRTSTGKIRAASYGRGLWEVDAYTTSSGCDTPGSLVEIDVEERSADFSWSTISDADDYTMQIRNSGSSTWFEFNPTDPNFSLVYFTPCTSYEWRIRANCGGISSDYSSIENFSTSGCTDYCDAYGSDSDLSNGVDEWIESVNLANVSHTSGNNWGYQDNFNLVAQTVQGDQVTAQLQPGFGPVGSHAVYWAIWIDFNQDDDFLDAGEQVFVSGSPSSSTVNASFMIPATAPMGVTRMRIAMKKGGPAASCGDFDFGEVEDYGIQINSGGSGGDYCTSGGSNTATDYIARIKMANLNSISGNENGGYSDFTNLTVNAVKGSSYNIIFTPNLPYGNNRWRYWRVWIDYNQDGDFEDANELAFESVNAFQLPLTGSIQIPLSVQSGQTRMRVSMKYVAPSNLIIQGPCDVFSHGEVEDYTIVLSDDASGYCQARGEFSDEIWIERVRLADINNFTVSNNGYAYFPNATTDLEAGTSYPVELTPGFVGTNIEVFWRVYIDFNQDEDFDDPGELVEQSPAPQFAPFNGSVAIPQNVPAGTTRMRVMMKFVNSNEIFYPTQCSDFLFGEVEDYMVTIVGGMDPPVANFSGTPTSGTAPLSVNFTDLSTGNPTSWSWNFGDGQTSVLQNPSVTYSAPGMYTVSLTVSNAGGNDTETKVGYIEVENVSDCDPPQDVQITQVGYSYCRADWTAVPGALQYQTRIRVVGAPSWTTGSMFTNNWRYWIGRTPNTTYELQVRLECATGWSNWSTSAVFTTLGAGDPYCYSYGSSTANYIDRVVFAGIDNESGQNFGYGHYTNLVGNVGTGFSYPITLTPEGSAADLYWRVWIDFNQDNDFEDAGEQVYQGQGDNATPLTGQIAIPLTAMTGTTRMRVAMGDTGYPEPCTIGGILEVEDYALVISSGLQAPQADFVATQVCGQAPAQIQFTDASSNMPTSWSWNFGNGQTSTTANPTASFANPGVYTVSLTVSNAAGSSTETKVSYITIVAPPQVSASPATTVCHGSPITLTASGSTTYDWIGPGLSSTTGSQVLVSPPNPGTYSYVVTGIVNGCSSAPSTIELNFTPAPTVSVSSSGNACLGDTVYLSATGALSYSWTGPGLLGTSGSSVAALPTANGLYSYEVIGTSNGCSSIPQTVTVSVSQSPVVQIMASSTEICSGDAISLTASGASNYSWTGSGLSSNMGSVVSALPTGTGVFTYSVTGSIGTCISPVTQIEIEVLASPNVDIAASSVDACVGESIELTASGANTYSWIGSGLSSSSGVTVLASPAGPGSYTYSVVGTSGVCSSPAQSITLQFNSIPTINAGVSPSSICLGQTCNFSGTGAANLIWSGPGLDPTQGNPLSFTPVNTGMLTFTVVGQNSTCSSNPVEVVLEVLETPELEIETSGNPICLGDTLELTGMGADMYFWNGPDLLNFSGNTVQAVPQTAGVFMYQLSGLAGVCTPAPVEVEVTVESVPLSATLSVSGCPGPNLSFDVSVENGGNLPNILWYLNSAPVWSGPNYTLFSAANGDMVYCTVTPVNADPCTQPTVFQTVAYEVDCIPLGIQSIEQLVAVAISPNPNSGEFDLILELSEDLSGTIQIYDPLGRIRLEESISTVKGRSSIPVHGAELEAGWYVLRLQTKEGIQTVPFVVE